AKADVRFRDPGLVRGLIVGAIREALAREGSRASTTGASGLVRAFRGASPSGFGAATAVASEWSAARSPSRPIDMPLRHFSEQPQARFESFTMPSARADTAAQ